MGKLTILFLFLNRRRNPCNGAACDGEETFVSDVVSALIYFSRHPSELGNTYTPLRLFYA